MRHFVHQQRHAGRAEKVARSRPDMNLVAAGKGEGVVSGRSIALDDGYGGYISFEKRIEDETAVQQEEKSVALSTPNLGSCMHYIYII